nr:hypothetical protein Iba_chr14cCG11520 [Ipomoea batatas]
MAAGAQIARATPVNDEGRRGEKQDPGQGQERKKCRTGREGKGWESRAGPKGGKEERKAQQTVEDGRRSRENDQTGRERRPKREHPSQAEERDVKGTADKNTRRSGKEMQDNADSKKTDGDDGQGDEKTGRGESGRRTDEEGVEREEDKVGSTGGDENRRGEGMRIRGSGSPANGPRKRQ